MYGINAPELETQAALLRDSQQQELRRRQKIRDATARLKRVAHAPEGVTDLRELKNAARHLIRLLEA
jgi:hypothetical protein